eukprot:4565869-Ditylum_brightwellii.AAC.1
MYYIKKGKFKSDSRKVWGCSAPNNPNTIENKESGEPNRDPKGYDSSSDSHNFGINNSIENWTELTEKQQYKLARDTACYVRNYDLQHIGHSIMMIPPCIDDNERLCHPLRVREFHEVEGSNLGYQWGCDHDGSVVVGKEEIMIMINYPEQEKKDATCYAKEHDSTMHYLCDDSGTDCDANAILMQYIGDGESSPNSNNAWGCSNTTSSALEIDPEVDVSEAFYDVYYDNNDTGIEFDNFDAILSPTNDHIDGNEETLSSSLGHYM